MTLRRVRALGLGALWLLWAALAWAQAVLPVPELRSRVIDQTGTLDAAQQASLESRLAAFETQRGTQIVVLLVPTTQPEDIADYTQRLGDAWKIGRQDVGDGVLFVVAKNDRRVRIATSKALEGAIPDLVARRIIDQAVTPAFRRNDFAGGIGAGVDQIMARVSGENLPLPEDGGAPDDADFALEELLIILVIALPMLAAVSKRLFGTKPSVLLSGGISGATAWLLSGVFWIAAFAALIGMVLTLFLDVRSAVPGSTRSSGSGLGGDGFGGGDFGGRRSDGDFGGGGFSSGGGGDFGGGGASGSW